MYGAQRPNRTMLYLVIGLGAAMVIALILFVLSVLGGSGRSDITTLTVRADNLQALAEASQKRIKSQDLGSINVDTNLLTSSDSTKLHSILLKKFGIKNVPSNIIKNELDTDSDQKLKDAELLNKFDLAYRQLLRDKIASVLTLARKIQAETGDKNVNQAVATIITNLTTIDKQLAALSLQ